MPLDLSFEDQPVAAPPPSLSRGVVAIRAARAKLNAPPRSASIWPVLGAAALMAASALVFAAAVIVGLPKL